MFARLRHRRRGNHETKREDQKRKEQRFLITCPSRVDGPRLLRRLLDLALVCSSSSLPCASSLPGLGLVAAATGAAAGVKLPEPVNVSWTGVESLGGAGGLEHASPSHSTGRGGAGAKPPSMRAS